MRVLLAALAASLFWQQPASAQQYPAYSNSYNHNSGAVASYVDWMRNLPDGAVLASLSIPGTHDSGTYTGGGGDAAQTQSMSIAEQLTSGIRFLDIRVRYMNPNATNACSAGTAVGSICEGGSCATLSLSCDLWIFHGNIFMNVNFKNDVLLPVLTFLAQHPTEVVIMRVAQESGNAGNSDIIDAMQVLLPNSSYARYIVAHRCITQGTGTSNRLSLPPWASTDNYDPPDPPLQLGSINSGNVCDARGKLLVLPHGWGDIPSNFQTYYDYYESENRAQLYSSLVDTANDADGTPHGEQNQYNLTTNYDLYNKWTLAEAFFNRVSTYSSNYYNGVFYSNQLNGSGGVFPYLVASGQSSPGNGASLLLTGLTTPGFNSYYPDFPRIGCFIGICSIAFEGMNQLTAEYLNGIPFADGNRFVKSTSSTVGIVWTDFPGKDLIAAIANVNNGINLQ